jgi:raffinose/stachyose/melibiose transport system permease protein
MYSALKTQQEFMMDTISLPKHLQLENFKKAIEIGQLDVAFFNSLKITTTSIILIVIIGFVTGYVLARYQFKGRNIVYSMFLAGMLVPIHGLLVPTFVEFKKLGLLDHLYALNLPYVAFGLPLAIFLTESFVKTIPVEIEEAAYMDGSSMLNTMFRIVLPICRPVMATILILSFLQKWNEFPFALVLLQSSELKTITVAIANFTGQFTVDYTRLMAALVMATGPVILLYLAAHKKVVQGMTAGAVKG